MKILFSICRLLIIVILIASCNNAPRTSASEELGLSGDTLELANQAMQTFIDSGTYAMIIVRTIKNGEVAHNECFGYSDIKSQTPVKEDDIFRMYSMTKPVAAAALMTLYDDGKFKLDDPVSNYLPYFADTKVYTESEGTVTLVEQENPITIRNLLTHTSGLTYGWDRRHYVDSLYSASGFSGMQLTLGEMVEKLASLPLKFQPGTKYEYGLSLDVAGYLIEVLSGKTLDVFMEEVIFDPLGMDDSGFYVPEDKHDRLTTLYTRDRDKNLRDPSDYMGANQSDPYKQAPANLSAGAGLVSTIGDYERFCRMLLNGGELDGVRVLKESTVDMIMSDQLPEGVNYGGEDMGYGLGGFSNKEDASYGWSGIASTDFALYPEEDMIIISLSQLFSDYTYARVYKSFVTRALLEE